MLSTRSTHVRIIIHINYHMHLISHGTNLSWIVNLLIIRRFYFHRYCEQIDMVDHLVPENLHN